MALTAAAATASAVLTGCGADDDDGPSPAGAGSTEVDEVRSELAGQYPTYVSLGDSYTAAPVTGQTDACMRSPLNYPAMIAAALGAQLSDASCSGADTTAMIGVLTTAGGPVPAQFDSLTEDTSLVTVSIGVNDFGLFGTLVINCPQLTPTDPTGAPCRDAQRTPSGGDALRDAVALAADRTTAVISGIRDRSPDAEVVVVGYPEFIPRRADCPDRLPLAAGDQRWAAAINAGLAQTQKAAALAAGATYVDLYAASRGHDYCSAEPWVSGAAEVVGEAAPVHPTVAGQRAVADLVLAALADRVE